MSGIGGDFKALAELRHKVAEIADGTVMRKLRTRLGAEALDQVQQEFQQGRNPYGTDWRPSERSIKERGQTLRDTGRLLNSFSAHPTLDGFEIRTDVAYAAIHQYGGVIHRKSQTLILDGKNRFMSRRKAMARKRGSLRFRRTGDYEIRIVQRQMIPEGELGWRWTVAFEHASKVTLLEHMGV